MLLAGERIRPVALAGERVLPVLPALAGILPDAGLRRGSTVVVDPVGGCGLPGTSLASALLAGASASGSWCAAVGVPQLGLVGAASMGIDLSRLALVPSAGEAGANVIAALLDAVDVVLLGAEEVTRPADARRLAARARERGTVLVVLSSARWGRGGVTWPVAADLHVVPVRAQWRGLRRGHGLLRARLVEVEVSGKGAAARPRRTVLWLPSPDGTVRQARQGGRSAKAKLPFDERVVAWP